ncbi:MAG: DUF22 domain-containing protein [Candidatus Undinarchaeales archaeon]
MTTIENFWKNMKKGQKYRLKKADVEPQYLIATENVKLNESKTHKIPVKTMRVPGNHVIHLSPYSISCHGAIIGICEKTPKPIDLDRYIESVYFHAAQKGKIKKGDVLGHFIAVPLHTGE